MSKRVRQAANCALSDGICLRCEWKVAVTEINAVPLPQDLLSPCRRTTSYLVVLTHLRMTLIPEV